MSHFFIAGAVDELFSYQFGKLPYRSLRFDYQTINKASYQDAPVVAYPQEDDFTRITEYSKLPIQNVGEKTTIAVEYSLGVSDNEEIEPYYPVPTEASKKQYDEYFNLAQKFPGLFLCGRLADYKYYNMDNAILRAFEVFETIF